MTKAPPSSEYVLTVPEAGARYFGIGRSASYGAANRGEIPTMRIGRRLFVPIEQLERMISPTTQDTEIKNGNQ